MHVVTPAEQVIPDAPYLRSAILPDDKTYDNPYVQRNAHNMGQIWSAFLWETRKEVGEDFDKTVYQSLHYLNAGSDFGDAIEALMLADMDANPSFAASGDDTDPEVTGHLSGTSCGLDIATIAASSIVEEPEPKYDKGPLLFQACGQIANIKPMYSLILLLFSLSFPLILPVFNRKHFRR